MKHLFAVAAAAALAAAALAGCGAGAQDAAPPPATLPPAPTASPQTLYVEDYLGGAASPVLDACAAATGLTVAAAPSPAQSGLVTLYAAPDAAEDGYRDLSADPLLAAAVARAGLGDGGAVYALPLGRCLYGYWADSRLLQALLGAQGAADLAAASYGEWTAFVERLTAWIADPAAAQQGFSLNGVSYALPAEKPAEAASLRGVFAVARGAGADAPAFTAARLAAGGTPLPDALAGALNGLCSALMLEADNAAGVYDDAAGAAAALAQGSALLARLPLYALAPHLEEQTLQALQPLPVKTDLVEEDLFTEEYSVEGLTDYPILTQAGYLAIPASASEEQAQAAASALLWLYGSAQGERALTGALLVTPWDTASDATALGALQVGLVGSGVLPDAVPRATEADRLSACCDALRDALAQGPAADARAAFRQEAAAILGQDGDVVG